MTEKTEFPEYKTAVGGQEGPSCSTCVACLGCLITPTIPDFDFLVATVRYSSVFDLG